MAGEAMHPYSSTDGGIVRYRLGLLQCALLLHYTALVLLLLQAIVIVLPPDENDYGGDYGGEKDEAAKDSQSYNATW
jgi:hypothetical protein